MRKTNVLAVTNLSEEVTILQLATAFKKQEIKIKGIRLDNKRGRNGNPDSIVGYVEFTTPEDTEAAYESGFVSVSGNKYDVYFARRQEKKLERCTISDKKLCIKGLPKDMGEDQLTDLLGKCKITGFNDKNAFLFAEYESPEKQKEICEKLNKMEINGSRIKASPAYEKIFTPRQGNGRVSGDYSPRSEGKD